MEEAQALGLLARTAPAAEAEGAAIELAAEIAAHPPAGLRRLKAMFRAYEGPAGACRAENDALVAFQREGAGLPQGARRG